MKTLSRAAFTLALLVSAAPALAATAVTNFTGGTLNNTSGQDLPFTVGWTFTPTANITVTRLGLWDVGGDGFADRHQIGIWSSAGTLLVGDVIPAGTVATLDNGFRYIAIAGLNLTAGQTYTIGANMLESPTTDAYVFSPATVTTSALINFGQGVRSADDSGFAFPALTPNSGRFGPNFQFNAVPEPASWALMIGGFAMAGTALRRRRTRVSYA